MLRRQFHVAMRSGLRAKQQGVVLIIALIVLVAMTLAGLALMRSVDTTNLIAGNMAYQQAAIHSGDAGIATAFSWLSANNSGTVLQASSAADAYAANGSTYFPSSGSSWDAYWMANLAARSKGAITASDGSDTGADSAGNQVRYVIDRMCMGEGAPNLANCTYSPLVSAAGGQSYKTGQVNPNGTSLLYYRITVRISGPRNTVSYVQAMVAM